MIKTKISNAYAALAADRLIDLKKDSGSNPWPVIDEILKLWKKSRSEEFKSYLVELDNIKKTRKVTKGFSGVSKDKSKASYTVYIADIPEFVIKAIRMVYDPEELPMTKEFFTEFTKRYPAFKVAKKT
jgi:hypothetical protein